MFGHIRYLSPLALDHSQQSQADLTRFSLLLFAPFPLSPLARLVQAPLTLSFNQDPFLRHYFVTQTSGFLPALSQLLYLIGLPFNQLYI